MPAAGRESARPSTPRRRWTIAAGVLGLAAVAVMAAGAALYYRRHGDFAGLRLEAPRPNVVLITLDTTRADRLGSYGYAGAATPALDRLAAAGVRFTQASSPAPLTLPAHASLMTGRNPYAHGVRNNGYFVLGADVPTLAERFAAAGYETAAFVSSFVLDRQFGLARGFAHYDDALDPARGPSDSAELERRGDRTVAAAVAWLENRGAITQTPRPFFLWVHLYDAHEPYNPPATFRAQFEQRPYDGEIAFQDTLVDALLSRIGFGPAESSPLVIVAGDHGESLGDHGESTHGLFIYESVLRVPLIVAWPGVLSPRVVDGPASLVDVAPTISGLAGLAPFASIDGGTLEGPLRHGDPVNPPRGVFAPPYAETYFPQFFMSWAPLRSVRDGRWKLIDAPEPELYDLVADPGETTNRFASEPATARALRRQLEAMARGAGKVSAAPMSAEAQRRLASLGYVSAAPATTAATATAPDPKRMVGLYEQLLEGNRALAIGRGDDAARLARDVLKADATNAFAQLVLGRALLATGQPRPALDALRAYLAAVPGSADAHHWMALAHLRLSDRARAIAEEEAAIALDPRHTAALSLRAGLLFSSGRKDEGVQALATAVAADPGNVSLRVALADLLADAGRATDAEAEYRRVLTVRPNDVAARLGLGVLLARANQLEPAIAELTRVLELAPAEDEARYERAVAFGRLGRTAEARAGFERLDDAATRPDIRQAARRELARLR